jgi:chromosome segregation ATPase
MWQVGESAWAKQLQSQVVQLQQELAATKHEAAHRAAATAELLAEHHAQLVTRDFEAPDQALEATYTLAAELQQLKSIVEAHELAASQGDTAVQQPAEQAAKQAAEVAAVAAELGKLRTRIGPYEQAQGDLKRRLGQNEKEQADLKKRLGQSESVQSDLKNRLGQVEKERNNDAELLQALVRVFPLIYCPNP